MRINTNVAAMNTHRQLQTVNNQMEQSLERLSSGQRINRAADDAAGLAISEQMRGQVSGLNQAADNAQDATSLIQTAEGALNESHEILQRMRELAVQSANDTLTESDRAEIQEEVDQLTQELTRISETTEYNTQELLDGTFEGTFHIGANEGQNIEMDIENMDAENLGVTGVGGAITEVEYEGIDEDHDILSVEDAGGTAGELEMEDTALDLGEQQYDVLEFSDTRAVDGGAMYADYGLVNDDGEVVAVSEDGAQYTALDEATEEGDLAHAELLDGEDSGLFEIDFTGSVEGADDRVISGTVDLDIEGTGDDPPQFDTMDIAADVTVETDALDQGTYTVVEEITDEHIDGELGEDINDYVSHGLLDEEGNLAAVSFTDDADQIDAAETGEWYDIEDLDLTQDADVNDDLIDQDVMEEDAEPIFNLYSTGQMEEGDEVEVRGEGGIDVSSQAAADAAITQIDNAIETVSSERSELGAVQNRLEHTTANLGVAAENLSAAESRIRDVDMADEMMEFQRTQILEEAGTAMMAQANMAPQSVLQLLG